MATQAEALWEINNEYRKRLSLLMGHMKMLEQLLKMQSNAEPALRAAIRRMRATLEDVDADLHNWRHTFYYQESAEAERRRMVDGSDALFTALETFADMMVRHLQEFTRVQATMLGLPRPPEELTRVIKGGDLWGMCLNEMESLATFDQFMRGVLAAIDL